MAYRLLAVPINATISNALAKSTWFFSLEYESLRGLLCISAHEVLTPLDFAFQSLGRYRQ